jgi:hypothetical protein
MKIYVILSDCDEKKCGNSIFITATETEKEAMEFLEKIPNNDFYVEEIEI